MGFIPASPNVATDDGTRLILPGRASSAGRVEWMIARLA